MGKSYDRSKVAEAFIDKIFSKIDEQPELMQRYLRMLEFVIIISEKKGLNVKPHSALRQGVPLTGITVKFQVHSKDFNKKIDDRVIEVEAMTTATVWEFKE